MNNSPHYSNGYSTITPRAYISDACYRLMKFLENKLKDENGNIDDEKYDVYYKLITDGIPIGEILRRIEQVYSDVFEEAFTNASKLIDTPKKEEVVDEIIEHNECE